ncbi:MAG: hypothetical protein ACJA1A_003740 [Saprospiraceae bacterium]|jgi:hypothetical protein
MSWIWATDNSLIWHDSFLWLTLSMWVLVARNYLQEFEVKNRIEILFSLLIGIFICHHFLAIFIETQSSYSWNSLFGKNKNYTSSFIVVVLPYLLFTNIIGKNIKFIAIFIIGSLILLSDSVGCAIVFILQLSVFLLIAYRVYIKHILIGGMAIFVPSILFISKSGMLENHIDTRTQLLSWSWLTFIKKPFVGFGSGNWAVETYNFDLTNSPILNDISSINSFHSHDTYSKILVELGIIGIALYLLVFIALTKPVKQFVLTKNIPETLQRAAIMSVVSFVLLSAIYATASFRPYFFSEIGFVGFTSLAIVQKNTITYSSRGLIKYIVLLCLLMSITWYTFSKYSHDKTHQRNEIVIKNGSSPQDLVSVLQEVSAILEKPFIQSDNLGQSLFYTQAILNTKLGNYEEADRSYKSALSRRPYDRQVLLGHAQNLYFNLNNKTEALNITSRFQRLQSNYYPIESLASLVNFELQNHNECRQNLSRLFRSEYTSFVGLVEYCLYYSDYTKRLLGLNNFQAEKFNRIVLNNVVSIDSSFSQAKLWLNGSLDFESNQIANIINLNLNQEWAFLELLNQQQFVEYHKDRNLARVNYFLESIVRDYNIEEAQKTLLIDGLLEFNAKRRFYELKANPEDPLNIEFIELSTLNNDKMMMIKAVFLRTLGKEHALQSNQNIIDDAFTRF